MEELSVNAVVLPDEPDWTDNTVLRHVLDQVRIVAGRKSRPIVRNHHGPLSIHGVYRDVGVAIAT